MIDELLTELPETNEFQKFLMAYKADGHKKVVVCGCGNQGLPNALLLQEMGARVWAFADNDDEKIGTCVKGIRVMSYDDLVLEKEHCLFVNNDSYRDAKKDQLVSLGVPLENIFTFDVFNPLIKVLDREYIMQHKGEFDRVYAMLSDQASRNTYIKYLSAAITGDMDYYKQIEVGSDYFIPGLTPERDDHVYLDIGAYTGDTIESFMEFAKGRYEKIYAFEPFESSARLIEKKNFPKIDIHIASASDSTGQKSFYLDNYGLVAMASTIKKDGEEICLATETIDDAIKDGKATLIKMDIEGSELAALHGAERTIIRNKPFLAICVYHKKEDLISIIPYIKQIVPEYKVYLRHHSNTGCDLVAYFVVD